ncbi:MAG: hypothetical protein H6Q57_1778 [Geobacteraceae bacterium]|nr:hypothetical protein [Geobacteraceae bacterium]
MIKKGLRVLLTALFCSLLWVIPVTAGPTGNHYTNGGEGIKAASVPGPGFYYRLYNFFYDTDDLKGVNGESVPANLDVFVYAQAHRLIWVTPIKILGGDWLMDVVVPVVYTDFEAGNGSTRVLDDHFALGDVFIEPLAISWHGDRWDAAIGLMAVAPVGEYDPNRPAMPGKGYWSGIFTAGGTFFPDKARTWSISYLGRYEIHGNVRNRDLQLGDDYHFEWGIGKALPPEKGIGPLRAFEVGVVGYAQFQINDDSGDDVTWDKNVHDRVYAVGPEVRFVIPQWKTLVELRTNFEFEAKDRTEGIMGNLTITKAF